MDQEKEIQEGRVEAIDTEVIGDLTVKDLENEIIEKTLNKLNHNRRKAARALGISERTLYRKIREYGIVRS